MKKLIRTFFCASLFSFVFLFAFMSNVWAKTSSETELSPADNLAPVEIAKLSQDVLSAPSSANSDDILLAQNQEPQSDDPSLTHLEQAYLDYLNKHGSSATPPRPRSFLNPALSEERKGWLKGEGPKSYIQGDYQASFGIDEGDFIWKRANPDLNESNWRLLWDGAYNRQQNTFDPAIYSQLRVKADFSPDAGIGLHSYIDVSPWSFIGKTDKVTATSTNADTADIQLKYWANTNYTIGEIVYSNLYGDSFSLSERKVKKGKIPGFQVDGFAWDTPWGPASNTFVVPDLKINYEFQPLREIWVDFVSDSAALRIFPAALQDQAYSSDDPLRLSNRHTWWAPSPWLSQWKPGNLIVPEAPYTELFYKGWWDESISYLARNSAGERLTNLRGFTVNLGFDEALIDFSMSSPKNLWQDFDEFDTLNSALRAKYSYSENLLLGFTHTSKQGFDSRLDAFNHVFGIDTNYGINDQTALSFQLATSLSEYDRTSSYETDSQGNTYHASITHASHDPFGRDYYAVRPDAKDDPFYRAKLSLTRMDKGFDAALADYQHMRDDAFWSRHITFRRASSYQYFGVYGPSLGWDDLYPFRIGDGIDAGRNVINVRFESEKMFNYNLDFLVDNRDVRANDGDLIENVSRLEGTYRLTERLRFKGLGIYHHLPKTQENIDPFVRTFHKRQDLNYRNYEIEAGKDPSLKTFSAGVEYDFFDWMSAHFAFERSNDTTLAYDNFPRGLFGDLGYITTYTEDGKDYRQQVFELYNTSIFPTPPYPYYNIFKTGILLEPVKDFSVYLTYTRNDYSWAQIIDDNMNHFGLETSYIMDNKLGLYLRYVYARANNLYELAHNQQVKKTGHHNVFSEVKYRINKDSELIGQYGVGGFNFVATPTATPFGGGVAALDTQHIFRLYYRKKF